MKGLLNLSLILQLLFGGAFKMKMYMKVFVILWLSQHMLSEDVNSSTEVMDIPKPLIPTTLPMTAENVSSPYPDDLSDFTVINVNQTIPIGTTKDYSASTENTELHFTDNLKSENVTTSKDFELSKDVDNKIKEFSVDVTTPVPSIGWKHNHSQLIYEQDSVNGSSGIRYEMHFSFNLANNPDTTIKSSESLNIDSDSQNKVNSDLFLSRRQDKSASIDNQQQYSNVLSNSATTLSSPLSTKYDLSNLSTTSSILETQGSSKPDFKLYPNTVSETASTTSAIQNNVQEAKEEAFLLTIPKFCSNFSMVTHLLNLLNVLSDDGRTGSLTCEELQNLKIDSNAKEIFIKINELLKSVAETNDAVLVKVYPNSTLDLDVHPQLYDGLCISMLTVYIICGSVLLVLVIVALVSLYIKFGRKHTTSLNLPSMSHLHMTDYNFGPIPRPSVSFSESNKGSLHAYASENYSIPRHTNTLNKRNGSGALPKMYDEVGSRQEMQTFTMAPGRQSDFKASASQDYVSAHSWDALQESNYPKKFGVDNPIFRRW